MIKNWLLLPPVAFLVVLLFSWGLSTLGKKLAFKNPKQLSEGARKSYACGEDMYNNAAQPDYSQFFPFAFFFTIAHVTVLMVATAALSSFGAFAAAMLYIAMAVVGLFILYRE